MQEAKRPFENPFPNEPEEIDIDVFGKIDVPDPFLNQLKRVLTSSILIIPAYIIAYLTQQYIIGAACMIFGYDPSIDYNHIQNLPFDYREWSFIRVTLIFSSGPLLCFIIGLFFLDFFNSLRGRDALYRTFVLWLGICYVNILFGFLLFSPVGVSEFNSVFYKGFSIVGTWWRMNGILMIPIALIGIAATIITGYLLFDKFLKFSFSHRLIYFLSGRRKIIVQFFLLPLLVAAPVLLSLSDSKVIPIHAMLLLNLMIMGIGMYFSADTLEQDTKVSGNDVLNAFPVFWYGVAISVYALVWIFLT